MALQNTAALWPNPYNYQDEAADDDNLINASGEEVAQRIQFPATGTLINVGWSTDAVADGTDQIDVRIETEHATAYGPSGTLYVANATGSEATQAASTWYNTSINGGTGVSVTQGDIAWIRFSFNSWSSGSVEIRSYLTRLQHQFPMVAHDSGSGFVANQQGVTNTLLTYSGPTYYYTPFAMSYTGVTATSSTLEHGARFQVPFPCRVIGVADASLRQSDTSCDIVYNLYADATAPGGSALASTPTLLGSQRATAAYRPSFQRFSAAVELSKDTWYRVTREIVAGTGALMINRDVPSTNNLTAMNGTANYYYTIDDGASGWTDTTTRVPPMRLVIDQLDDGVGSGGILIHPGMSGGMRG